MAPTQALFAACLLELLNPKGTRALRLAVRHLACWGTMLFLLPDPFLWWLAPAWVLVIAGTHAWWVKSPRVAAVLTTVLLLPALVDVIQRMDPAASVAAAGARNPWVAQANTQDFGMRVVLPEISFVVPSTAAPKPLLGNWKSRTRGAALLVIALMGGLVLSRRQKHLWLGVGLLPVGLAWMLLRPPSSQDLWLQIGEADWQILTFLWPQDDATPLHVFPRHRLPGESLPSDAMAMVERGPLLAPKESGEEGILPLLRHWADATADPNQEFAPSNGSLPAHFRWEIDSQGLLVLRALL